MENIIFVNKQLIFIWRWIFLAKSRFKQINKTKWIGDKSAYCEETSATTCGAFPLDRPSFAISIMNH